MFYVLVDTRATAPEPLVLGGSVAVYMLSREEYVCERDLIFSRNESKPARWCNPIHSRDKSVLGRDMFLVDLNLM